MDVHRNRSSLRYLRAVVTIIVALTCGCVTNRGRGDDIWASGYSLPIWQKIDSIQRFPFFESDPKPVLAAACRDPHPLVRLAACMAIGRTASAEYIPDLVSLLDDSAPLVRQHGLAALMHIQSPRIKEPLINVLGSWEILDPPFSFDHVQRLGLPDWLINSNTSLADRQRWLREFDANAWKISFDRPSEDGRRTAWLGLMETELDAGQEILVRLRISRRGGAKAGVAGFHDSRGWLSAINERGEEEGRDADCRFLPAADRNSEDVQLELPPDGDAEMELVAVDWSRLLRPGFYLFHFPDADWPLLLRLRRSAETERQIPQFLEQLPAHVQTLGEQRVAVAARPIIESLVANAGGNTLSAAKALARIGDPRAIPVLLEYPEMQYMDCGGNTRDQLASFGTEAWPHYERQILQWKELLAEEKTATLTMSLRMLGPNGSKSVDLERLRILEDFTQGKVPLESHEGEDTSSRTPVVSAAVEAAAPNHTSAIVNLIWEARQQKDLWNGMMLPFQQPTTPPGTAAIAEGLWRRAQGSDMGAFSGHILGLALRFVPELALKDESRLASPSEARLILDYGSRFESTLDNTIRRLEQYVQEFDDCRVEVGLGLLYFRREENHKSEELLRKALRDERLDKDDRLRAHYYLGEILRKRGQADAARGEFEKSLELVEPDRYFAIRTGFDEEKIQRSLARVEAMADGVVWEENRMLSFPETNARIELKEGYAFYLDRSRRLLRWDPDEQEERSFGVMPNPVRQFIPASRESVFVLFTDGTSAFYRMGQRGAIWNGPEAIGFQSHLTASPAAITVADDRGVLYALDPEDGDVLWKYHFQVRHRYPYHIGTSSGRACQAGPYLLVPDELGSPLGFVCLRISDGTILYRLDLPFPSLDLSANSERILLAGPGGQVMAVDTRDGKMAWRTQLEQTGRYTAFETHVARFADSQVVYLSVKERIWVLDYKSGRVLWQWKWSPRGEEVHRQSAYGPYSRLIPLESGIAWSVDWEVSPNDYRTDLVHLSDAGDILLHWTSPLSGSRMSVAVPYAFCKNGRLFVSHGVTWQIWNLSRSQKAAK